MPAETFDTRSLGGSRLRELRNGIFFSSQTRGGIFKQPEFGGIKLDDT